MAKGAAAMVDRGGWPSAGTGGAAAVAGERDHTRRTYQALEQEYARRVAEGAAISRDPRLRATAGTGVDAAARATRAAQLARLGTLTWDARSRQVAWSDEMCLVLGQRPGALRQTLPQLFALVHPDDRATVRRRVHQAWRERTITEVTYRVARADASTGYVHCHLEVLADEGGAPCGIIATGQDVTGLELARQERDRLARRCQTLRLDLIDRDPVTGLLTRARFADEIDRAQRAGAGTVLVIAAPPPPAGHAGRPGAPDPAAGDDLVAALTAEMLHKLVRPADVCGVVGRNEFGVLMQYTPVDAAVGMAEAILDGLCTARFLDAPVRPPVHAGLIGYDGGSPASSLDLLIDAEAAWRRARRGGQPLHVLRQPPSARERQETCRARVRAAVAGNRFTLYAQPLRDLALNRVTRHELLLRILDDGGTPAPPSTFLDIAEYVDEILPVDQWVIDHAMRLIGGGPQQVHHQINLSGRSISDSDLLDHVRQALLRHGVDPTGITFEITETALIGNLTEALRFADGVRTLGCQLALDDFGAGFTSYTYLKYFPIDMVKIDGEFIHDLPRSPADQAIVRSLVQVCHDLGIRTAAEYVQDEATVDLLRAYGVDFIQGYHVGRPRPVTAAP